MTEEEFNRILESVAGERADTIEDKPDPRFTERQNGRTPNGGDYSVAFFYDKNGSPCPKAQAKRVNIVEYASDGTRINEAYALLDN